MVLLKQPPVAVAEVDTGEGFTLSHLDLNEKEEGPQSQLYIRSVLLPEKSVCKGVMLWS